MTAQTLTNSQSALVKTAKILRRIRSVFSGLELVSPKLAGEAAFILLRTPIQKGKPRTEEGILAAANRHDVPFRRGTLAVYEWGNGPTVLMVHGYQSHSGHMRHFVEPLVEAGFRVLAYDGPAHGNSSGRQTTPFDNREAIYALEKHFGGFYSVLGHSFGGATTLMVLQDRPDFSAEKIVLLAAPDDFKLIVNWLGDILGITDKARQHIYRVMSRKAGNHIDQFGIEAFGRNITHPTLVIHDEEDDTVPFSAGKAIAREIPQATFIQTKGLGHRKILSDPEIIQKVVNFIRI